MDIGADLIMRDKRPQQNRETDHPKLLRRVEPVNAVAFEAESGRPVGHLRAIGR